MRVVPSWKYVYIKLFPLNLREDEKIEDNIFTVKRKTCIEEFDWGLLNLPMWNVTFMFKNTLIEILIDYNEEFVSDNFSFLKIIEVSERAYLINGIITINDEDYFINLRFPTKNLPKTIAFIREPYADKELFPEFYKNEN